MLALCVVATVLGANCVPKPRSYQDAQLRGPLRVAILPLANYTESRDASARVAPILFAQMAQLPGITLVDPGAVEAALSEEPWLLFDRIPPDLVDRFGETLGADALLVGSVQGYGYRRAAGEQIPHFSVSLRLMQTNFAEDVAIDWVAREVGLSRPHFFKLFKKQMGITPNLYLNTLRSEQAIDELMTTNKSVTDIGYDLGFSSQASFTRFFASNVGIPPSEYRRVAHVA